MKPKFFKKQIDFRNWLEKNHTEKTELLVGLYKVKSEKLSISWPQSVDEALCFGWIDGIRKSIDDCSYCIRFTPRRKGSMWSTVNLKRIKELLEMDLVFPLGKKTFENRDLKKAEIYAYEQKNISLSKLYEEQIKANKKAWDYFQSLPPSTKKPSIHWVMSAKKEETRLRRLATLILRSEDGKKLAQFIVSKNNK